MKRRRREVVVSLDYPAFMLIPRRGRGRKVPRRRDRGESYRALGPEIVRIAGILLHVDPALLDLMWEMRERVVADVGGGDR